MPRNTEYIKPSRFKRDGFFMPALFSIRVKTLKSYIPTYHIPEPHGFNLSAIITDINITDHKTTVRPGRTLIIYRFQQFPVIGLSFFPALSSA